jgi:hypothetical protein
MKWSAKMSYNIDLDDLEEMYREYLDEQCKCNIEEDGCSCMDFDTWFEEQREFWASCWEDCL